MKAVKQIGTIKATASSLMNDVNMSAKEMLSICNFFCVTEFNSAEKIHNVPANASVSVCIKRGHATVHGDTAMIIPMIAAFFRHDINFSRAITN